MAKNSLRRIDFIFLPLSVSPELAAKGANSSRTDPGLSDHAPRNPQRTASFSGNPKCLALLAPSGEFFDVLQMPQGNVGVRSTRRAGKNRRRTPQTAAESGRAAASRDQIPPPRPQCRSGRSRGREPDEQTDGEALQDRLVAVFQRHGADLRGGFGVTCGRRFRGFGARRCRIGRRRGRPWRGAGERAEGDGNERGGAEEREGTL